MTTTDIPAPTARPPRPASAATRRPGREREGAAWVFLSPWVLGAPS